tara:strand:+ start:339 stop:518 length:180 start_codon:yes stop_codon:yes gene_type:complete
VIIITTIQPIRIEIITKIMILKKTLRFSKKVDLSNLFNKNFIKEVVFFKNNKTIDPTKK